MGDAFSAVFWGVLTFSILVVLHEGGHFVAARTFGVKVHEFMLGLPGPAIRWRGKKTTYGITAIPLGGYVRIAGMEPGPEDPLLAPALAAAVAAGGANPETLSTALDIQLDRADELLRILADWGALTRVQGDDYEYELVEGFDTSLPAHELLAQVRAQTYRGLSFWKRVTVLSMGVIVNLITAILVFTVVLSAFQFYWPTLQIDRLSREGGAMGAGVRAGDTVVSLNGERLASWNKLATTVATYDKGDKITLVVIRDGAQLTIPVVLGKNPQTGNGYLGVQPVAERTRLAPTHAFVEALRLTGEVFKAIGNFFNPQTFQASLEGARSVVGVSVEVSNAARSGLLDYAAIVALLSLSLGAMNILPIPPLDGGKIVLEIVERLSGRPLPRAVVLGFSAAGALMLFALIGYLMYADTVRYIIKG